MTSFGMKRDVDNQQIAKKLKIAHEQVILISTDQGALTVDEKEAELSGYISDQLKKSRIILLPVDQEVLSVVVNALKALKNIKDKGITSANLIEYNKALNFHLFPLLKIPFEKVAKVLNASDSLGIAPLCSFIKLTIVKLLTETTDIAKLQQFMEKLMLLDGKLQESIKNDFLIDQATKVVKDLCEKAKESSALSDHLKHMTFAQLILLIKLDQLNPLRIIDLPCYKNAIENFGEIKCLFDSYFNTVAKNRVTVKAGDMPDLLKKIEHQPIEAVTGNAVLQSKDGQQFSIACTAAQQSNTLKDLIQDSKTYRAPTEPLQPIPFLNINGKTLSVIVESLQKIAAIAVRENYGQAVAQALDPLFLGLSAAEVIELLKVVNYLDVKVLFDYMIALCSAQLQHSRDIDFLGEFTQALIDEKNVPKELQNVLLKILKENSRSLFEKICAQPVKILDNLLPINYRIALSPDGLFALTASFKGLTATIRVWDLTNDKSRMIKVNKTYEVALSPDCKKALTLTKLENTHFIILWDLTSQVPVKKFIDAGISSVRERVSITFCSDGKSALFMSKNRILRLDLEPFRISDKKEINSDELCRVISYGGKYALTLTRANTAFLWDCQAGKVIKKLTLPFFTSRTAALSSNGKKALLAQTQTNLGIGLWCLESGKSIKTLNGRGNGVMNFSGDGKFALTVEETNAQVWDIDTGQLVQSLIKGHAAVIDSIAFRADAKQVLTGCRAGRLCLWNLVLMMDGLSLAQLIVVRLGQQVDKNKLMSHSYFGTVCKSLPPGLIESDLLSSKGSINPISALRPIIPKPSSGV